MKKIRIAQIGININSHGGEIFHTLKKFPEIFEIAGYAIVEDERETCAHKLKDFDGYRELPLEEILNDPSIEAVTVETDEIHLLKYAQMAADHGKHIHMEKPGSPDVAAFEKLIETVKRGGKVFHIGYMYRYNPFIKEAIASAKRGEFGTIHSVEAHMSRYDKDSVRAWFSHFKGGMMFYLGCHLIDLVLQIQGMPEEIIPMNCSTGKNGIMTEDYGFAVLKYPNGISFVKMTGAEVGGGRRRQLVITGETKSLEIKPLEITIPKTKYSMYTEQVERALDEEGHTKTTESRSELFDRYEDMMQAFGAMVRGETLNPYTADYELELFKVIMRCCGA